MRARERAAGARWARQALALTIRSTRRLSLALRIWAGQEILIFWEFFCWVCSPNHEAFLHIALPFPCTSDG